MATCFTDGEIPKLMEEVMRPEEDRVFFAQHDARWIDNGQAMVYSNGLGRPEGNFSSRLKSSLFRCSQTEHTPCSQIKLGAP